MRRCFDALVLDIDGTLLDNNEHVHPRTTQAIARARAAGVVVMLATGRPHGRTSGLLSALGLDTPAVVYNGAAVYCPLEDRLIERRVLPDALVSELHQVAVLRNALAVIEDGDRRYARAPRTAFEARVLSWIECTPTPSSASAACAQAVRFTFFCERHKDASALHDEVGRLSERAPGRLPFGLDPLKWAGEHEVYGLDVHPLCDGKAEVFRVLQTRFAIPAERVVAVGDADNDLPMLIGAGFGVAMGNATSEVREAAHRVIGDNNGDSLACLIDELFVEDTR